MLNQIKEMNFLKECKFFYKAVTEGRREVFDPLPIELAIDCLRAWSPAREVAEFCVLPWR